MSEFNCPNCKQPVFSTRDKYFAAKWKILVCPHCEKRVTSQPLILAGYYLLYLMDVIDLGGLAVLTGNMYYLVAMAVIWVILDLFSIYLPLAALRDAGAAQRKEQPLDPAPAEQNAL
ncbi:MAG: hypothetical protein IT489_08040 [Gammaproteobacteria bacterium]|nr:hypothetical protein [Gammaproteobacteria bacterium]